ncbi:MAG: hypothetical protein GEV13_10720 [Rhodospirillales bacterium]|nr:hypothetical protein [Rhodospirillales bacterium]
MTDNEVVALSAAVTAAATIVIAIFTFTLWLRARQTARAYLVGGGDVVLHQGKRKFRIDIANYGNTPGHLTHFDLKFTTAADAESGRAPTAPVSREHHFRDQIPPGGARRSPFALEIPDDRDVAYGAFWYLDIWNNKHEFRFVLRLYPTHSRPDLTGVHRDYNYWN